MKRNYEKAALYFIGFVIFLIIDIAATKKIFPIWITLRPEENLGVFGNFVLIPLMLLYLIPFILLTAFSEEISK